MMKHIVESCPLTGSADGFLHSIVDDAVTWLRGVAIEALTK